MWIREIWHDLYPALILGLFDHCWITSSDLANYGSQLRHFTRTNELFDGIESIDPAITDDGDGPAFDVHHGDEWEERGALNDSDNDEDKEDREE